MKKLAILSLGIILLSCGEPGQRHVVQYKVLPVVLNETNLFNGNIVRAFLKNEEKEIAESNELFLMGVNSYRNEEDLDSAKYYFLNSIYKYPTSNAYFELGNISFDQQKFDDAEMAYSMAEMLDFKPVSKILYNRACMYAKQEQYEKSAKYVEYAIQAGYKNIEHIEKDPDLQDLREERQWLLSSAIKRGLEGVGNAENLYWLQFKSQFPVVKYPTTLKSTIPYEEMEGLEFISYDYEKYIAEMRDEAFSREVSKGFYYAYNVYETDKFVALVYMVRDEFMGDYAPLLYRVATFSQEGKLIDKKVIAGSEEYNGDIRVATIKDGGVIDVQIVKPIFEKDSEGKDDYYGLFETPMSDSKLLGNEVYTILPNGKINVEVTSDLTAEELVESEDI